jgi:hypothetical protein
VHADDVRSEEFFENRIRPVLAGTCFRCHGGQKVGGGLRVDARESLLKGGGSGPAIDVDEPSESLLVQAIRRDDGVAAMPPDRPLSTRELNDLTNWVKAGAPWPKASARFRSQPHWAFQPVRAVTPPVVGNQSWIKTSVDQFILARMESAGRKPAPPADRRNLLRRVTYDLTGLSPTSAETAAFEADSRPGAFERVVDRLLDSPHYGEHWARHWLDVVRYADTAGENSDHPLPHAWRYRNWVIQALNEDEPYDRFIREQIAGDLLARNGPPEEATKLIIATGYLAIARRFGHDISKDMHLTYADVIDTVGKSVLGLSLGCCRCHDHKYDPLTARDYYGLYGIFESTRFAFPGCEPSQQPRDLVTLPPSAEAAKRTRRIDVEQTAIDAELNRLNAEQAGQIAALSQAMTSSTYLLSRGQLSDGTSANLTGIEGRHLDLRPVKCGEVIRLSIAPRGNHGADSTLVELEFVEIGGQQRRWNVADLVNDLTVGNPHADTYGNAGVWSFLDDENGPRLLPESLQTIDGRRELQAWRNGDTPSVFVNTSDRPVPVWTTLPARRFFMHPGPRGSVAVAWTSPMNGQVSIRGRIADAHPGGDGVGWCLEQFTSSDVGPRLVGLGQRRARITEALRRRAELEASRPAATRAYGVADGVPHDTRLHRRGEPADLGDLVPRKFPDVLGGQEVKATDSSGRLELAHWLTDLKNPLTARVIVNRVWHWHFGRGLVTTPNDFGTRGAKPTHPELLDYLANQFIRSGWSLKALHREILLSATYRQAAISSEHSPWYDAFARRRLTAEELRDTLLATSGDLDATPGASHPFPPEATWSFSQHAPFAAEYETRKRSVYVMQKRNRRSRFFALFDGPDPNESTPQRDVTTVPPQALFFMNDPFLHEQAARFASRVRAAGPTDCERLDEAYQVLLGRNATDEERSDAIAFLQRYSVLLADRPEDERAIASWEAYARVLFGCNEVLYVD